MNRIRFAICSLLLMLVASNANGSEEATNNAPANRGASELEIAAQGATVILFKGGPALASIESACTATAFKREGDTYYFASAAHCADAEDDVARHCVKRAPLRLFIAADMTDDLTLIPVEVLGIGYRHDLEDVLVFRVKLDKAMPTIPLADEDPILGENVFSMAAPHALGKQLLTGRVSGKLNRTVIANGINLKGSVLLQMGTGEGASGAAFVSPAQKGIVAFMSHFVPDLPITAAVPVSVFKKFWRDIQAGQTRWCPEQASP